VSEVFELIK